MWLISKYLQKTAKATMTNRMKRKVSRDLVILVTYFQVVKTLLRSYDPEEVGDRMNAA